MRSLRMVVALAMVVGLVGVALAQPARRARPVMGELVKVEGANLVVKVTPRGGEAREVTIVTDDKTTFTVDAEAGKLADLKAGMTVAVMLVEGTTDKAARVNATSKNVTGTVVKVEGPNVVLSVRQRGAEAKEVTVVTDEKTKILLLQRGERGAPAPPKVGTLEDVKAGMRVTAIPETGTATKLLVSAVRARGERGGTGGQT